MSVRALGVDDLEQTSRLNQQAFGYRTDNPLTDPAGLFGIDGPAGLAAIAKIHSYKQFWGGRRVPMGGIAGVVVEPHSRGRGLAKELMRGLLAAMHDAGQPVSALFPTGVGIYRPTGWEVVGYLDDTRIATRDLAPVTDPGDVTVRAAGADDVPAIAALYAGLGINGLLTREGPSFPKGAAGILEHDVVTVAESAEGVVGYASYNRGTGYREQSELRVWECLGLTGQAAAALLRSIASWSTVAPNVLWRGPTEELGLHLSRPVPTPVQRQPWMLRIVDAATAIALRGFPAATSVETSFVLQDADVTSNAGGWRLRIEDGSGSLEQIEPAPSLPVLSIRGLALLYAGAADAGVLLRTGHLDRPAPSLSAAFAVPPPRLLDYF